LEFIFISDYHQAIFANVPQKIIGLPFIEEFLSSGQVIIDLPPDFSLDLLNGLKKRFFIGIADDIEVYIGIGFETALGVRTEQEGVADSADPAQFPFQIGLDANCFSNDRSDLPEQCEKGVQTIDIEIGFFLEEQKIAFNQAVDLSLSRSGGSPHGPGYLAKMIFHLRIIDEQHDDILSNPRFSE
jgi:hypothetical protein